MSIEIPPPPDPSSLSPPPATVKVSQKTPVIVVGGKERITRAEFARRTGVHRSAIKKAIDTERLTLGPDNRIAWPDGREELERNTRPDERHHGGDGGGDDSGGRRGVLLDARAGKVSADAELAKLKLEERRGALVPLAEVRGKVSAAFVALRDRLMAVPHRVGNRLADLVNTRFPSHCEHCGHELDLRLDRAEVRIAIDKEQRAALRGFASEYREREREELEGADGG